MEVDLEEFNSYISDKETLYNILQNDDDFLLFLPKINSPSITVKYLMGLGCRKYYGLKKTDIKKIEKPFYKGITKADLYFELHKMFPDQLGFDETNLPDKRFLAIFLHTVDDKNKLFKQKTFKKKIQITQE